jgi:hypothetical protein
MNERKNIDRLFQEKFKDFEDFPHANVWKNIEKQISKKKKRRILPLWLRLAGAAAILLLVISSGLWIFNSSDKDQIVPKEIIITDSDNKNDLLNENDSKDKIVNEVNLSTAKKSQEQNLISKSTKEKDQISVVKSQTRDRNNKNQETANTKSQKVANNAVVATNITQEEDSKNKVNKFSNLQTSEAGIALEEASDVKEPSKNDIQTALDKTNIEEKNVENKETKWSIGSTIAPVYYNTLSNGSPIDGSLSDNDKTSNGSVSYGLKVNYKLNDKLSFQSGINTLELGYTTENVATLLSSSLLENSSTNINTNIEGVSLAVISTERQNSDSSIQRSSIDDSGTLDQTLGYVEIPMELKYNISQKKLGVNVLGGFSTYFLYRNQVSFTSFGKTTTLGEASNINSLNFSGNLGLDFDYNISKKLYINISPVFKYQFNTFSRSSGGFQPYYLGIYSGLNFRF